ncbi:MAG: PP2C family protein-serine/threonine phosphatase [Candidatus Scatovivens sp.]
MNINNYNNYVKNNIDLLKNSLTKTFDIYGMNQIQDALFYLLKDDELSYFTRKDNSRLNLISIGANETKKAAIREYINLVLSPNNNEINSPIEEAMKRTFYKYQTRNDAYEILEKCVVDCIEKGENHFTRDNGTREKLDAFIRNSNGMKLDDYVTFAITEKLSRNIVEEKQKAISTMRSNTITSAGESYKDRSLIPQNIRLNAENLEKCRSAIISGVGFKREGTISIGTSLHAATSIGNKRKNQEDAVLIMEHPRIPGFKMLVVADGMGGLDAGEYASNETVQQTKKWFESLDESYYTNPQKIEDSLGQALQMISDEIYDKKGGRCGSTFVGAIIGKNETLIANVGDSRAYALAGTELEMITEDQSVANDHYKLGIIQEKDDMRFYRKSNIIKQHIGMRDDIRPNYYILRNQDYDSILLFSDGVTDCLSDSDILAVTRRTDRRQLAKALVDKALVTDSKAREGLDPKYYAKDILGGKDNATAAVFSNENESDGNYSRDRHASKDYDGPEPGAQSSSIRIPNRRIENENEIEIER